MSTKKGDNDPLFDLNDLNKIDKSDQSESTDKSVQSGNNSESGNGDEYPKSSITVIREDGKKKKKMVGLQGLSHQILPPLMKKRVATYEMIVSTEIDPLTKEPVIPGPCVLPGTYMIYDPFQEDVLQRHRMLRNVTRQEIVTENGKQITKDYVEDITLDSGGIVVSCDRDYLLYVLLELHPLNASNKWRDKNIPPAFKRTDIVTRSWADSYTMMELSFAAEETVVKLKKTDEIIALATAAGVPTAGRLLDGDSSVKYDLRIFARKNPKEFFKLNKNAEMAVKFAVIDAVNLGLIEYSPDKRTWVFSDGDRITLIPGEDPEKGLIKKLQEEEYADYYKALQEQLNYWE